MAAVRRGIWAAYLGTRYLAPSASIRGSVQRPPLWSLALPNGVPATAPAAGYKFMLGWLLDDQELGLVIKPLKPGTLRSRLGEEVSRLLDEAIATGRCHFYDEGIANSSVLPNEAAQAADIAVNWLIGGTAGLESALAGVPTILMDVEHLYSHPLYEYGKERFIFHTWDELKRAVDEMREIGVSEALGDWNNIIDEMDPFRDGGASRRMGRYIGSVLSSLQNGADREAALSDASAAYEAEWGSGMVTPDR